MLEIFRKKLVIRLILDVSFAQPQPRCDWHILSISRSGEVGCRLTSVRELAGLSNFV